MPWNRNGFTLVEVLVVVLIIGIISAAVVLSMGNIGDDRELQREARRMSSLVELASEEAVLQGRDFGLELQLAAYRFLEFDPLTGLWNEVLGDDALRARRLAADTEFELYLEDKRVLLDTDAAETSRKGDADPDYLPHVLILSSGDITPFDLDIIRHTDRAVVSVSVAPNGEITVGNSEDERL